MEYYSAIKKNTFESVLMRWMKLEPIIHSEVSQKEKTPIQYINTYIWNLERWQWRPCVQDRKKDTAVYNGLLDSEGEGEGGMIWKNGTETCILSCKKRIASLCSIQDIGCLGLVHGDDPEGWSREMIWGRRWEGGSGLGTHVHPWLIHVNVWQNQYSIVKQNKVKIKLKKK